jgi:Ser/Thr protein kinase RdoA (MazF antagonist)
LVDHVKWAVEDAKHTAWWLGAFDRAVVGYERVLGLSEREAGTIWPTMLAIQLPFAYWMFLHRNWAWAAMNMRAFSWLYEHRGQIAQSIAAAAAASCRLGASAGSRRVT